MHTFTRNNRTIEWDPANPIITCLMSVYNGETYLREAIDSILDQTHTNFEFLIINDGSTDDTVPIIESYDDPRIRLIHNDENIGLTKSLNKGIDLSRGKYIARMDADDVSMVERFEKQVRILNSLTKIRLVADEQQYTFGLENKINTEEIDVELLFHNCIAHSSVMFRRIIDQKEVSYNDQFIRTQDYDLWTSSTFRNSIMFLGESLITVRNHENRISSNFRAQQDDFVTKVHEKLFLELGLKIDDEGFSIFKRALEPSPGYTQHFIVSITSIFKKLLQANKNVGLYNQEYLKKRVQSLIIRYLKSFELNTYSNFVLVKQYAQNMALK